MICTCKNCNYTFESSTLPEQCPDCGKKWTVREATDEEKQWYQRIQEEKDDEEDAVPIEDRITCQHIVRVLHAAGFSTMEQLASLSKENLMKIRGVGEVIAADLLKTIETYKQESKNE